MQLSQKSVKLLADMLHSAPVKEHKIEDFRALADVFVPLCQATACRLCLHR